MPAAISKSMVMSMLMCVVATCVRMVMAAVFMPVRKMLAYVLRLFTDKSEWVIVAARAPHQRIAAHSLLHKGILRDAPFVLAISRR